MTTHHTDQTILATPLGRIRLCMTGAAVSALDYVPADTPEQPPVEAAAEAVVAQLTAYFRDPRDPLTIPLAVQGTVFQRRVWAALQAIPPGTVRTYGALAQQLGTSARAIGGACRANPVPILIPCHRVVGQQGLGGYTGVVTGDALEIKRWLLRHEGVVYPPA